MPLSDLIGAADVSDFVTQVETVSADSLPIGRGAVVSRKEDGTVALAGAGDVDSVYGIVLDTAVPSALNPEVQTCTVARSGVYDATSLTVAEGSSLADFEERLRELGIFLEKVALVPSVTPAPPANGNGTK
jgi:hypothetical protein